MLNLTFNTKAEEIRVAREIINSMFTWGDFVPEYAYASPALGNIQCIFCHRQRSPHGKFYWDDEKEIMVLHCFRQHVNHTCYDYVMLILIEQQQQYKDVWEFLIRELGEAKVQELVSIAKEHQQLDDETLLEQKKEYIDNTYNLYDDTCKFINSLYNELD